MSVVSALPPLTLRDLVAANDASASRTPGCHVTQVIYAGIMPAVDPAKWGPQAKSSGLTQANSENWQEAGFVWEELLSAVFAARARTQGQDEGVVRWRPGELTRDGIIGSPDALVCGFADFPDVAPIVVEEYKCTWKSRKSFDLYDKRYLPWLMQMRCYCCLSGTTEARLYVLHINGGYDGYIPEVAAWRLQFTPAELHDQWQQLVNTAKKRGWI